MFQRTFLLFSFILLNLLFLNANANSRLKKIIEDSVTNFARDHRIQAIYQLNKDSEPLILGAQGFANMENNQRLSVNDQFPILSMTHQMTAVSLLILEEQGLVNTQDKLSKFLPDQSDFWGPNNAPAWTDKVTLHNLLSHSSGIPKYWGNLKIEKDFSQAQIKNALSNFLLKSELEFTPGTKYSFSNSNYVLLGKVIESVTKKSIKQFFEEDLFPKAALHNTFFLTNEEALELFKNDVEEKYLARYFIKPQNGKMQYFKVESKTIGLPYADAGVISNSGDLIRWNIALHEGKLLSKTSYKKLITPYFKMNDNRDMLESYMGYAIFFSKLYSGYKYYHNNSKALGMNLDSGYIPAKKISVSIFSNTMLLKSDGEEIDLRAHENQVDLIYLRNALFESI